MSVWTFDGKTPRNDVQQQRIAAGTVGGEHGVPSSFTSQNVAQIVKPFDPRIHLYGGSSGSTWTVATGQNQVNAFSGYVRNNAVGAQISMNFSGATIAFYASIGPDRGKVNVYIDGVLTPGLVNLSSGFGNVIGNISGTYAEPTTDATAMVQLSRSVTTIPMGDTSALPSSGTVYIDSEQITYTSKDASNLFGCTRGTGGTTATTHKPGSTVYNYSPTVEMYAANRAYRQLMYFNPFIAPGEHTILLEITTQNVSSSDSIVSIEGFVIGGVLGTGSLNTHVFTIDLPSITTDGSGIATSTANIISYSQELQLIGILGIYDSGFTVTSWQWDASSQAIKIKGTVGHTYAAGDIKVTAVFLGRPF